MLRPMPLPHKVPKIPYQQFPFEGLVNPRPLDITLPGTLPGYDTDINDTNLPEVTIRHDEIFRGENTYLDK